MFEATVWINGREAGRHRGGFTTWTCDITGLVTAGTPAELLVGLKSLPGQLNAAQTGGLIRPVLLLALPPVHIGRLHCRTCRSTNEVDFDLHIQLELAGAAQGLKVRFDLTGPDNQTAWSASYAAGRQPDTIAPTISAPLTWDGEHPRLYTLTCTLCRGDLVLEQVSQAVGFREIHWGDGQLQVNGRPVKLRGVCYQACAPATGKAISPDLLAEGSAPA
jgi:beta-galactosidase/beta-glucuronidase